MAREFSSDLVMEYRGLGRKSGSFHDDQGREVDFVETARFEFDDDGVVRNVDYRVTEFDEVADFDVLKLTRGDLIEVRLTLVAYEKKDGLRSWFETISAAKRVKSPATVPAAA